MTTTRINPMDVHIVVEASDWFHVVDYDGTSLGHCTSREAADRKVAARRRTVKAMVTRRANKAAR